MLYLYLKKLEVQGFKSFADKINLEFNAGITSVVGPNGSGKSNISDAVRWVLGEQSAKTLRGAKMEDIIFAGTEHRKPLGFAEVSLTIDNNDRMLPVDYTEVTITRRVYRSGESEYFINKTSCRLKDIHEMLMDTGLGKDGYSIIGQGRVDEILSTRSEDRRHIFEEASGIMKYKVRKLEAEKKLELTQQNLLRINDIINELGAQLEPLQEQSETARRFLKLREQLKEIEVSLYVENIAKLREKVQECQSQLTAIKENIEQENQRVEAITRENRDKTELSKRREERLNQARQEFFALETQLEKCNAEIQLNDEKKQNLAANNQRLSLELEESGSKREQLLKELGGKEKKLAYLENQYRDFSSKLEEYQKQLDDIIATLDENEKHIETLKASVMDKLDLLSDKRTQTNNIRSHMENLAKRQNAISSEILHIKLDKDKDFMRKEDLGSEIRKTRDLIHQVQKKIAELNTEKGECDGSLADLRNKQAGLRSEIQFKSSRLKLMQDMEKNLEGYNRSVREVLHACRQSEEFGKGIHGALAQLLTVDKKFETAVEMTLGGALQNIVTSTEEAAKKAIEYLKTNRLGRATFLPISAVKGKTFDDRLMADIRSQKGFCGIASELVKYDPVYEGIIHNLLGKVVVVDNLDAGIQMARRFSYSFRIVTLEGDVLSTTGSMAGGSSEGKGTGILTRNREIPELTEVLTVLRKEDGVLEKSIQDLGAMLSEITAEIAAEETTLKNHELLLVKDESQMLQVEENIRRADARIGMLEDEKQQLDRQREQTAVELQKYQQEWEAIEQDIADTKRIIAENQEKNKEDQSVRDALHSDITDFRISVNSIQESMESVKETSGRIRSELEDMEKGASRRRNEMERNLREIASLEEHNQGLERTIKGYNDQKTGKTLEIDRLIEDRRQIDEELADILDKINQANKNIVLLQEEQNRLEVRGARTEAEIEAMQNRMWDEYELTYNNALEIRKEIGNPVHAQRQANELKVEIKSLGNVNVASIDEYVKTKERFEFMSVQRNDMEQAQEKLRRVITEMTSIMKKQFMEQFHLINQNFSIVFRELFDGGKASLILTDIENVLESGIEIEVQPPGKKLQNMMLLSGGERAFTAIALLFSILRLRPTPFCIMDEIEAALDDANVYRFAQYIKRFTEQTQFIMVTHRKGTMEASDTLYGVTMEEHGISKVVSMRLGA